MTTILIIGDAHIPKRGSEIPPLLVEEIKSFVSPSMFDYVIYTGDIVKSPETIGFLRDLANKRFLIVQGNMDYYYGNREAPLSESLELVLKGDSLLSLAIIHGAELYSRGDIGELLEIASEKNANILISGHTHKAQIFLSDSGVLLLNPGSCTGSWSFVASGIPSFLVLKVDDDDNKIEIILYELKNNRALKENHHFNFENNLICKFF